VSLMGASSKWSYSSEHPTLATPSMVFQNKDELVSRALALLGCVKE